MQCIPAIAVVLNLVIVKNCKPNSVSLPVNCSNKNDRLYQ